MKKEIYLGVNVDHVATLRQARFTRYPSVVQAALMAEQAGADGITIHLREDRRHIQDKDVWDLKPLLNTRMNLEMAVTPEMCEFALEVKPEHVCLVPEKREELTTEGGLDVVKGFDKVVEVTKALKTENTEVSLFIEADKSQIQASFETGAQAIELHTGAYAEERNEVKQRALLSQIAEMAEFAQSLGLIVNAGHGLDYHNVVPVAKIACIHELNIGHAIIARAVIHGLERAVSEMKKVMHRARA